MIISKDCWIDKHGYVYERKPNHPLSKNGRVAQHRRVWYDANGPIPKGCVIHHINHNPNDNRIKNLQCLTASEHTKIHHPSEGEIELTCYSCKKKFKRSKPLHRVNLKGGCRNTFCGKSCWSSYANMVNKPFTKLRKPQVMEIKRRLKRGVPIYLIAKTFKMSHGCISDIAKGRTWRLP